MCVGFWIEGFTAEGVWYGVVAEMQQHEIQAFKETETSSPAYV